MTTNTVPTECVEKEEKMQILLKTREIALHEAHARILEKMKKHARDFTDKDGDFGRGFKHAVDVLDAIGE